MKEHPWHFSNRGGSDKRETDVFLIKEDRTWSECRRAQRQTLSSHTEVIASMRTVVGKIKFKGVVADVSDIDLIIKPESIADMIAARNDDACTMEEVKGVVVEIATEEFEADRIVARDVEKSSSSKLLLFLWLGCS